MDSVRMWGRAERQIPSPLPKNSSNTQSPIDRRKRRRSSSRRRVRPGLGVVQFGLSASVLPPARRFKVNGAAAAVSGITNCETDPSKKGLWRISEVVEAQGHAARRWTRLRQTKKVAARNAAFTEPTWHYLSFPLFLFPPPSLSLSLSLSLSQ